MSSVYFQNVFRGLKGCNAVVTGASSGIGRQFAIILAQAGMNVAITARRTEQLRKLEAEIAQKCGAEKPKVLLTPMDVTQPSSVSAAMDSVFNEFGSVHCLVNNAGVAVDKPAVDITPEEWDFVMNTNLKGAWLVQQAVARRVIAAQAAAAKAAKEGKPAAGPATPPLSIINVTSLAGLRQATRISCYGASKAGLIQLTKILALEWARYGIRVNSIAPGYFRTEMNDDIWDQAAGKMIISRVPTKRIGDLQEDLTGTLLLLASDAGKHITGTVIPVDGGHLVNSL